MPRITHTVVETDCDICHTSISEPTYVGAMVYGVAAHESCWSTAGGPVIARLLDLDDIRIRETESDREIPDTRYGVRR